MDNNLKSESGRSELMLGCKIFQSQRLSAIKVFFFKHYLLAHLSQRLIGEIIVYPLSGVRPSLSVRPSSSTMLKHLLLRNGWANQSQIVSGASLGRGTESLFATSGSHDQGGHHAYIW